VTHSNDDAVPNFSSYELTKYENLLRVTKVKTLWLSIRGGGGGGNNCADHKMRL